MTTFLQNARRNWRPPRASTRYGAGVPIVARRAGPVTLGGDCRACPFSSSPCRSPATFRRIWPLRRTLPRMARTASPLPKGWTTRVRMPLADRGCLPLLAHAAVPVQRFTAQSWRPSCRAKSKCAWLQACSGGREARVACQRGWQSCGGRAGSEDGPPVKKAKAKAKAVAAKSTAQPTAKPKKTKADAAKEEEEEQKVLALNPARMRCKSPPAD